MWTRNVTSVDVVAVPVPRPASARPAARLGPAAEFSNTKLLKPITSKIQIDGTKNHWGQHSLDPAAITGGTPGNTTRARLGRGQKGAFADGGKKKSSTSRTSASSKLSPTRGRATKFTTGAAARCDGDRATRPARSRTPARRITLAPRLPGVGGTGATRENSDGLRTQRQLQADWTMINLTASGGCDVGVQRLGRQ
jgi:hypothetical protein